MKENYNVRQIVLEDYPTIDKWHEQYGEKKPKSSLLPLGGLGGFIIEKNQVPVAAIYLYVTNSSMGYFDFLISYIYNGYDDRRNRFKYYVYKTFFFALYIRKYIFSNFSHWIFENINWYKILPVFI